MADFLQTISNSLQVFGGADSKKWGEMVWGVDFWATDNNLEIEVEKVFGNTLIVADSYSKGPERPISNTVIATGFLTTLTLQDAAGYSVVFPSRTTNGVNIASSVFNIVSGPSDQFSIVTFPSTVWSEL